jgi:hypothetical protein
VVDDVSECVSLEARRLAGVAVCGCVGAYVCMVAASLASIANKFGVGVTLLVLLTCHLASWVNLTEAPYPRDIASWWTWWWIKSGGMPSKSPLVSIHPTIASVAVRYSPIEVVGSVTLLIATNLDTF